MGWNGRDGGADRGRASAAARTAALAAACVCAACTPPRAAPAGPSPGARAGDSGFLAPPTLVAADWTAGGGVRLTGRAPPDATVRLQAPDGRALGVTADAAGGWTVELPATAAPSLYAVSASLGGRILRGEGALAVAPRGAAAAALTARAGAPADVAPAAVAPPAAPRLQAVDFDGGGGLAAAGRAPPGAGLKLRVDGVEVGAGAADAAGRFALPGVGAPLAAGEHRVRVEAASGAAEAAVDTTSSAPLAGAAFRAVRVAGGWRVDWTPPGGGVQSLLWLDAPGAAAGSSR